MPTVVSLSRLPFALKNLKKFHFTISSPSGMRLHIDVKVGFFVLKIITKEVSDP